VRRRRASLYGTKNIVSEKNGRKGVKKTDGGEDRLWRDGPKKENLKNIH